MSSNEATKMVDVKEGMVIEVGRCVGRGESFRELSSDIGAIAPCGQNAIFVVEKHFHPADVEEWLTETVDEWQVEHPGEEPDIESLKEVVLDSMEENECFLWFGYEATVREVATRDI